MYAASRKIVPLFVLLLSASVAMGQVATGIYPYGTYDTPTPGIDTINVGNLNVHLTLPVLTKAGRGAQFSYNLNYDSSVYFDAAVNGGAAWTPVLGFGWSSNTQNLGGYLSYNTHTGVAYDPPYINCSFSIYNQWVFHDNYGISHPFNAGTESTTGSGCGTPSPSGSWLATDGSGYTMNLINYTQGSIASPSGAKFAVPSQTSGPGTITDPNGNQVSTDGNGNFTDTTGNVVLKVAGIAPNPTTYSYQDTSGNWQNVTMTYTQYTVRTNFGYSGIAEYGPLLTYLVNAITYPDGSAYHFSYEVTPGYPNDVTGRIASIETPQGNYIQYGYSGGYNGILLDEATATLTRTLNSDSGSAASTWTYTRTATLGTGTSQTAVVDGLSNNKVYNFVEASNQPAGTVAEYYETSRSISQQGVSTPVVARNTCYNGAAPPCTTVPTLPFSQIDTYELHDGIEMNGSTRKYNANEMQTEADVYDFGGSTSRGPLLRKEVWTYGYSIASAVTEDVGYDGSGNLAGETLYSYDGSALTTSSGVPQHIAVSGPRGNLTSETVYANSGTSYPWSATYEDTGSLLTSTTPNGTTTYTYDPTFVYNAGTALPTPSSGVALGTSENFDTVNTGLPLKSTDPNTQITQIPLADYDPMLRPTEIQYPDSGQTTWTYTPTTLTTTTLQTPNPTASSEVQLDGYARQSRTEVANGQSGNDYYQQDTCYDANGNASFSSYPYQSTGFSATKGCSISGTSITNTVSGVILGYDVLGRVTSSTSVNASGTTVESRSITYLGRDVKSVDENSVTRVSQIDGLGRTSVVCEITSTALQGVSPGSCGTDITPLNGFLTTYSYALATGTTTITQGVQTRTFQSDWLGRPTSVTEPESGITTYSYAYNSTGLAVTRTRPTANQPSATVTTATITQYDSLSRVLSITYFDGTPTKTFAYDKSAGADFTDLTQANLKGRLSLASVPTAMTAYSYDTMGRTTYLDECLPSGPCGTVANNHQLLYTYDLAGNLLTSTDGTMPVSSATKSTYAVSPASELLSLTSSISNGTNPAYIVSSVQNGPNGPASYSLGNGLSSVYGYDTLGRLDGGGVCNGSTSPSCTGGTQVYGFTNRWKGIQLQGSSDSVLGQTSTYGYDGFNRLTSRTVTSGILQDYTWGYDRYGNRWSQTPLEGGSTSSLSFTAATNQISTTGYTYDAAGNMTDDAFHAYKFDAEGNITEVDSGSTASYVYNALNQRVRTVVGTTPTEFVFNAAGQRASIWNGTNRAQLQGQYYWGSQRLAYYAGSSAHFQHQDWLGTERMRTTYSGSVEGSFTSLPFGDDLTTVPGGTDTDAYHTATLDHDYESETDHAQFRQYNNDQGRWLSPDPYGGSYSMSNPQSMNRYVYAMNNPLSDVDPSGLDEDGVDDGSGYTFYSYTFLYIIYGYAPASDFNTDTDTVTDTISSQIGFSLNGEGGAPSAPSNFLQYEAKVYSCNLQAELSIVKTNGIALGLDAAGYIPGEGVVAGFSQSAIATASFFNSAVGQDHTGMVVSAAGTGAIIGGIVQETGVAWAKAIPFIGWGVNTIATVHDLASAYSTGAGAYNACMNKSN